MGVYPSGRYFSFYFDLFISLFICGIFSLVVIAPIFHICLVFPWLSLFQRNRLFCLVYLLFLSGGVGSSAPWFPKGGSTCIQCSPWLRPCWPACPDTRRHQDGPIFNRFCFYSPVQWRNFSSGRPLAKDAFHDGTPWDLISISIRLIRIHIISSIHQSLCVNMVVTHSPGARV